MIMTFVTLLVLFFTYQLRHQIPILIIGKTLIYASFVKTSINDIANQASTNIFSIRS